MVMTKYQYKYTCPDYDERPEDARTFESAFDVAQDPEWVAEDAAEYDHDNCDGWESTWPKVIQLWSVTGFSLGQFDVERESVPQFHAVRVPRPGAVAKPR